MAVTAEALAAYIGLSPDDTTDLTVYLKAAQSKARGAGIPAFKNNAHYDLFIMALAAMYYDNRGLAYSGSYQATAEENARKMINSFVLDLPGATKDEEHTEAGGSP